MSMVRRELELTVNGTACRVQAGGSDSLAQNRKGRVMILRRPEHSGASKLHGAIAETPYAAATKGEGGRLI